MKNIFRKLFKSRKMKLVKYDSLIRKHEINIGNYFVNNYIIRDDDESNTCDDEYSKIQSLYIDDMKHRLLRAKKGNRFIKNPYDVLLNGMSVRKRIIKKLSQIRQFLYKSVYYVKNYPEIRERNFLRKKNNNEIKRIKKLLHLRNNDHALSIMRAVEINRRLIKAK